MKNESVDHTGEVESRLKAIKVEKHDRCTFFADKSDGISTLHDCYSCKWSHFKTNENIGLCKFKK